MHLNYYFSQASDSRDRFPERSGGAAPSPPGAACAASPRVPALPPVPPQPPLFPPPGVRISPKCWRSVTCMFNSFQKHREAIWRRGAPGSPGAAAAPVPCPGLGPGPAPGAGPALGCRLRHTVTPLSPAPHQLYSEIKLLPPLFSFFFFFPFPPLCPLSRAVNKAHSLAFAESCCRVLRFSHVLEQNPGLPSLAGYAK